MPACNEQFQCAAKRYMTVSLMLMKRMRSQIQLTRGTAVNFTVQVSNSNYDPLFGAVHRRYV